MATDDLLQYLRRLEEELHRTETRRDLGHLDALLHLDFEEFGRSGRRYDRAEVLREFSAGEELGAVHAQDFMLAEIRDGVALLTYKSAHVDPAGNLVRYTLRSSLWVQTAAGWQMRFHQGTPTDAFARSAT